MVDDKETSDADDAKGKPEQDDLPEKLPIEPNPLITKGLGEEKPWKKDE